MHYCVDPVSDTVGRVLLVTDDALTCASLGAFDTEIPAVLLPKLTVSEGLTLALVIVSVWGTAWVIALIIGLISEKQPTEET